MKQNDSLSFGDRCCVCGAFQCSESVDHTHLNLSSFRQLVKEKQMTIPSLTSLKETLSEFYEQIKTHIANVIEEDEKQLQLYLSKFYYQHIDETRINIPFICQIYENRLERLPSKKVTKIVNYLNRNGSMNPEEDGENNSELDMIKQELKDYLRQFQTKNLTTKIKQFLPYTKALSKHFPDLSLKKSISEISIPEQLDDQTAYKFNWKNVTLTQKSKLLSLNNKKINDLELMRQISVLSSFANLKQLQIRNNFIKKLGCQLIATNMSFLTEVDIRGNPVGDEGVIKLIEGITKMKKLMISQTGTTDTAGKALVKGVPMLQMLWCEDNRISGELAIQMGKKQNLRIMSLARNGIEEVYGEQLKKIFNSKGYVVY